MDLLKNSLGVKVLLLTSALTIAAFSGLAIFNSIWVYDLMLNEVQQSATRTADLLRMAIEKPMSVGDNEGTTHQFDSLAKHHKDLAVDLVDYNGEITYSTNHERIRQNIQSLGENEDLTIIINKSLAVVATTDELLELDGLEHFVQVESIENGPACYHCHGKSRAILGVMIMNQDISQQFSDLHTGQTNALLISLLGLVGLLGSLIFFMRSAVVKKIQIIARAAGEVIQGNLDAHFEVSGTDELGRLGNDLSNMVEQIKDQLQYNKSILSGISVPMLVTDKNENLEFINIPLQTILGKEEEEVLGQSASMALYGEERKASTGEVIATGEQISGSMTYNRHDGIEFPLHFETSPLTDAEGEVVGAICVLIDLTQEVKDRKDIEAQRESLLAVANEVTEVSTELGQASDELLRQMDALTNGVDSTADQTSRVATAMEEMNATVLEVAKNASETAEASDRSDKLAQDGGGVVERTITEISTVSKTTQGLASTLGELTERAQNIGHIVSVINDITDQTNLLALNAAIEAARAGEAGRGFAVVADEVRKLAEKTMRATKEVEDAISLIQESSTNVLKEMDTTRDRVENTSVMAAEAGKVLGEVVSQANIIADMVRNIATAAEEQSATSDEINVNVNEINNLSQEVSRGIQEANGRIGEVSSMAARLAELVSKFK